MSVEELFKRITSALDRAGIDYMLTGSFASAYYGVTRSTQDIDLVVAATGDQLRTFIALLPTTDYYVDLDAALEAHRRESLFNAIDRTTGWKVDFIIRKSRPFSREEFSRRRRVILQGVTLFITSIEDVIVSKLEWAKLAQSQRQTQDVAAIVRIRWDSLDRDYLSKWVRELGLAAEWENARRAAGIRD